MGAGIDGLGSGESVGITESVGDGVAVTPFPDEPDPGGRIRFGLGPVTDGRGAARPTAGTGDGLADGLAVG
jgi:hypothetical protein